MEFPIRVEKHIVSKMLYIKSIRRRSSLLNYILQLFFLRSIRVQTDYQDTLAYNWHQFIRGQCRDNSPLVNTAVFRFQIIHHVLLTIA